MNASEPSRCSIDAFVQEPLDVGRGGGSGSDGEGQEGEGLQGRNDRQVTLQICEQCETDRRAVA